MAEFDPYYEWLGIRPEERPISHYRLLGLHEFESNDDLIQRAADRLMRDVKDYQTGPHSAESQVLLNQLAGARRALTIAHSKAAYDAELRTLRATAAATLRPAPPPLPPPPGHVPAGGPLQLTPAAQPPLPTGLQPPPTASWGSTPPLSPPTLTAPTAPAPAVPILTTPTVRRPRSSWPFAVVGACAAIGLVGIVWRNSDTPPPPAVPGGILAFRSNPACTDLELEVDGRPHPLPTDGPPQFELPPGKHTWKARRPGFKALENSVMVLSERTKTEDLNWKPAAVLAVVWTEPERAAAEITIDGKAASPFADAADAQEFAVEPGLRRLLVRRNSGLEFSAEVTIGADERRMVRPRPAAAPAPAFSAVAGTRAPATTTDPTNLSPSHVAGGTGTAGTTGSTGATDTPGGTGLASVTGTASPAGTERPQFNTGALPGMETRPSPGVGQSTSPTSNSDRDQRVRAALLLVERLKTKELSGEARTAALERLAADSQSLKSVRLAIETAGLRAGSEPDADAAQAAAVIRFGADRLPAEEADFVADTALRLATSMIRRGDLFQAAAVTSSGLIVAAAAGRTNFEAASLRMLERIEGLFEEFDRVATARTKLAADPQDAEAAALVGRYECGVLGNWDKGLPLVAAGKTSRLKGAAEAELAGVSSPADCLRVGDLWWDAAAGQPAEFREAMRDHALLLYAKIPAGSVPSDASARIEVRRRGIGYGRPPGSWYNGAKPFAFNGRAPRNRDEMTAAFGGSAATEAAVSAALARLARTQHFDGSWSSEESGGSKSKTFCTGLALLAFLGAGQTQAEGEYRETVNRGLGYLLRRMTVTAAGGDFRDGDADSWSSHGTAALAITEAFVMTKETRLAEPHLGGAACTLNSLIIAEGGWRPANGLRSTLESSVWPAYSMRIAAANGIPVPLKLTNAFDKFLSEASPQTPEDVAFKMFCRIARGQSTRDEGFAAQSAELVADQARANKSPTFEFFATQVMFQLGGDRWKVWNERVCRRIAESQDAAGTWYDPNVAGLGRIEQTALRTLTLETYYRHIPMQKEKP